MRVFGLHPKAKRCLFVRSLKPNFMSKTLTVEASVINALKRSGKSNIEIIKMLTEKMHELEADRAYFESETRTKNFSDEERDARYGESVKKRRAIDSCRRTIAHFHKLHRKEFFNSKQHD